MLIGLVGCGGFGREIMPELSRILRQQGVVAKIVFVETQVSGNRVVNGYPVLSEAEFLGDAEGDKHFNIAIANSKIRETLAERFMGRGVKPFAVQSSAAHFYDANEIGAGSIVCAGSVVSSNVKIGRFFHCNFLSYVAHDCVIGDFVTFAPSVTCNGNVEIADHAYIGAGAILKNGVPGKPLRIGKGAIIGMGAVVTKDVPAGETWIGNPARPMVKA